MEGDVVGAGNDFVESNEANAVFARNGSGDEWIAANDFKTEAAGTPRDFKPDASQAKNAEGFAAKFSALQALLFPLACVHRVVGGGELAGQREHEADGEFGDGDGIRARSVHHHDAATGGGFCIDVVDTYTGAANDAQLWRVFHQGIIDLNSAADHESVGICERGGQAVRELVMSQDLPARFGGENGEGCGGYFFRQNNLHLVSLGRRGGPGFKFVKSDAVFFAEQVKHAHDGRMRLALAALVLGDGIWMHAKQLGHLVGVEVELLARDEKFFAK